MSLDNEKLLEIYRRMLLVRTMENTHSRLLKEGKIHVNAHLGTGQEAVSVGVTGPLRKDDILFGTHRGVGEYIGKGMSPKEIWLEYLGKKTGPCKGKGTQHLADRKNNIPGLAACLGSDFSMAVGTSLAAKMRHLDQVTLFFVGEGACNEGDANPSMCMAALWNLPLVFAVCTNQFCEMSYMREHFPTEDVAPRAAGYGIPYEIVDGQDIETTYEAARRAVEHARGENGPYMLEYKTFRMAPHHSGDTAHYVRQEDLDEWGKRDPIDLCQRKIFDRKILSPEEDQKLRDAVGTEVSQALTEAFAAPDPKLEDLFEDVYAQKEVG